MQHNWYHLLHMLVENAQGEKLDGSPGDWDSALYQLIRESYKQAIDHEDQAILAVLIVLHQAIQGKVNLSQLAETCVQMFRSAK